jgi:hypothetical protein
VLFKKGQLKMKNIKHIMILTFLVILYGCNINDDPEAKSMEYIFDFHLGKENWMSMFSDYPVGEELFYELEFQYTNLPEPLDTNKKSLKISGNNHSDDLFSAIYRKFEGLQPNTKYLVTFDIELGSNAPTNAVGVGGSPDLSIGAGGINYAPENTIDNLNYYRPNFESLLQSGISNDVFLVLGTIGVSDVIPTPFTLINRNNLNNPLMIESNSKGEIWLMIAIDSGFEGTTTLYYALIKIRLQ